MAAIRPLTVMDLFRLSLCNLDGFTETFNAAFYLEYLSRWPHLCRVLEGPNGNMEGYILGKVESSPIPPPVKPYSPQTNPDPNYLPWHGHITALTIASRARRLGLAQSLSRVVEQGSDIENAWFVDLFVKDTNKPAFELYRKMGYSVYRRITNYYGGNCDGLDMRKPMGRDVGHLHIVKEGEEFRVSPEDLW